MSESSWNDWEKKKKFSDKKREQICWCIYELVTFWIPWKKSKKDEPITIATEGSGKHKYWIERNNNKLCFSSFSKVIETLGEKEKVLRLQNFFWIYWRWVSISNKNWKKTNNRSFQDYAGPICLCNKPKKKNELETCVPCLKKYLLLIPFPHFPSSTKSKIL